MYSPAIDQRQTADFPLAGPVVSSLKASSQMTFTVRALRLFTGGLFAAIVIAAVPSVAGAQKAPPALRPELAFANTGAAVEDLRKQIEATGDEGGEGVALRVRLGWALIALSTTQGESALNDALEAFDRALNAWTEEDSLVALGMAHAGLGRTYAELALLRDAEENIKAALNACDEAVVAFIRADDGYGYALTQSALALTEYARMKSGGNADRADEAIKASQEALGIFTAKAYPVEFARTQHQLGLIQGHVAEVQDRLDAAEQAKQALRAAYETYSGRGLSDAMASVDDGMRELADRHPKLTWNERELAMLDAPGRDRGGARDDAELPTPPVLARGEPVRTVVRVPAGELRAATPSAEDLAFDELQAGYALLKAQGGSVGESVTRYQTALTHFYSALNTFTYARSPVRWAEAQSGVGAAYWGLRAGPDGAERVRQAIVAFESALTVYDRGTYPEQFAVTQGHLGAAYHYQARTSGSGAEPRRALEAYEAALRIWSAEGRPVEYARLCNSVADLYLMLADRAEPERFAQLALQMLDAAVKAQGREANPQSYADSQSGIGRAHYRLARTLDDPARLRDAIAANERAAGIYRSLGKTQELSGLQGTQGTIYLALSYQENRMENVSKAVAAYREAIDTMPATATSEARGTTQINLGTAYYQLAQMAETEANAALALAAFEQARKEIHGDQANPLFEASVSRSELVNKLLRETRFVFGKSGT